MDNKWAYERMDKIAQYHTPQMNSSPSIALPWIASYQVSMRCSSNQELHIPYAYTRNITWHEWNSFEIVFTGPAIITPVHAPTLFFTICPLWIRIRINLADKQAPNAGVRTRTQAMYHYYMTHTATQHIICINTCHHYTMISYVSDDGHDMGMTLPSLTSIRQQYARVCHYNNDNHAIGRTLT